MAEARHLTALSVPLPDADALVRAAARMFEPTSPMARIQAEFTAAHVTILAPFVPPSQVDRRVREDLQHICMRHQRHAFRLERVAAYPGGCVYMPPEPASALLDLMHDVWNNWPNHPPYEGQYGKVMPHVTLAIVEDHAEATAKVAAFAEPFLPLRVEARELQLFSIRDGQFELMCSFPLAT